MCQQAAWMLMLSAGQNEFTIFVTPPGIAAQVTGVPPALTLPPPPFSFLAGADALTYLLLPIANLSHFLHSSSLSSAVSFCPHFPI